MLAAFHPFKLYLCHLQGSGACFIFIFSLSYIVLCFIIFTLKSHHTDFLECTYFSIYLLLIHKLLLWTSDLLPSLLFHSLSLSSFLGLSSFLLLFCLYLILSLCFSLSFFLSLSFSLYLSLSLSHSLSLSLSLSFFLSLYFSLSLSHSLYITLTLTYLFSLSHNFRNTVDWRRVFDSNEPHKMPFPAPFTGDDNITPLQRLCVIRCLRRDKMELAIQDFIVKHLDRRFIEVRMQFYDL